MNDQSHTLHLSSKKSPPPLLLRLAVCPARPMPRLHGWTPSSPPPHTRKRWAEPSIQIAHPHPPPQSLAPHHPIAFSPLFPLDVDGAERRPRAPQCRPLYFRCVEIWAEAIVGSPPTIGPPPVVAHHRLHLTCPTLSAFDLPVTTSLRASIHHPQGHSLHPPS